jgi:(S)-citramalyl-CoA lyase
MNLDTLKHPIRSILFVPGNRPDRFGKAMQTGADNICIDLEDAVAPAHKQQARHKVMQFLQQTAFAPTGVFLRINPLTTRAGLEDVLALLTPYAALTGLVVPKVTSAEILQPITANLQVAGITPALIALLEDPTGLRRAREIAAHPHVIALALGPVDLAAATGMSLTNETLLPVRTALVMAAAEKGKFAIDGPFIEIADTDGLTADATAARQAGCAGKLAIHPSQVETINTLFTPSAEQLEQDQRIVEAAENSGDGIIAVDGKMVDKPVVDIARRRLALVKR